MFRIVKELKIVQHNRCPDMGVGWFEISFGHFSVWAKSDLLLQRRVPPRFRAVREERNRLIVDYWEVDECLYMPWH